MVNDRKQAKLQSSEISGHEWGNSHHQFHNISQIFTYHPGAHKEYHHIWLLYKEASIVKSIVLFLIPLLGNAKTWELGTQWMMSSPLSLKNMIPPWSRVSFSEGHPEG